MLGDSRGIGMEKVKQILKHDNNNHLADQVLEFEKTTPVVKQSTNKTVGRQVPKGDIDVVTSSYIRGYN